MKQAQNYVVSEYKAVPAVDRQSNQELPKLSAMELQSLENLERQLSRLLDQYRLIKKERDDLYERVGRLEAEANELRGANESLTERIDEARKNVRDPEKEERIRAKVDELLAKLEGF